MTHAVSLSATTYCMLPMIRADFDVQPHARLDRRTLRAAQHVGTERSHPSDATRAAQHVGTERSHPSDATRAARYAPGSTSPPSGRPPCPPARPGCGWRCLRRTPRRTSEPLSPRWAACIPLAVARRPDFEDRLLLRLNSQSCHLYLRTLNVGPRP